MAGSEQRADEGFPPCGRWRSAAPRRTPLVRNGTLPAMKVGGRGQWRVERTRLEQWIEQAHGDTERFVTEHPFTGQVDEYEQEPPG